MSNSQELQTLDLRSWHTQFSSLPLLFLGVSASDDYPVELFCHHLSEPFSAVDDSSGPHPDDHTAVTTSEDTFSRGHISVHVLEVSSLPRTQPSSIVYCSAAISAPIIADLFNDEVISSLTFKHGSNFCDHNVRSSVSVFCWITFSQWASSVLIVCGGGRMNRCFICVISPIVSWMIILTYVLEVPMTLTSTDNKSNDHCNKWASSSS